MRLFECRAMPRQLQNVCLMKHPATWPWFDPSLTGDVSDNVLDGCTDPLRRGQPLVSKWSMKRRVKGQRLSNLRCESVLGQGAKLVYFRYWLFPFWHWLIPHYYLVQVGAYRLFPGNRDNTVHGGFSVERKRKERLGLASSKACSKNASIHVCVKRSYLRSIQDRVGNLRSPVIHVCVKA